MKPLSLLPLRKRLERDARVPLGEAAIIVESSLQEQEQEKKVERGLLHHVVCVSVPQNAQSPSNPINPKQPEIPLFPNSPS